MSDIQELLNDAQKTLDDYRPPLPQRTIIRSDPSVPEDVMLVLVKHPRQAEDLAKVMKKALWGDNI